MLILSRIAAWAANSLTSQLGMGTYAHLFNGDNPEEWQPSNDGLKAVLHGRGVMDVILDDDGESIPTKIELIINNIYGIVRPKHVAEFDPRSHGVAVNTEVDWKGDKAHDVVATVILEDPDEQIPGLHAPRNFLPQHIRRRKPKATGSMDRRK